MKKINLTEEISTEKSDLSIYIHIPFCVKRCFYCDFCSSVLDKQKEDLYFLYLLKEIDLYKDFLKNKNIVSIFIGGGTPSSVNSSNILKIVDILNKYCNFSEDLEFTIEANPNSLTADKIEDYLSAGINRFSIGAQSFNNNLLKKIGRLHNKEEIIKTVDLLREKNIKNFNLDLMLGLPDQNLNDIEESIRYIKKLDPSHVSYYSLILEENTYMYNHKEEFNFASEDEDRKMYHYITESLEDLSYKQYEISNFAKDNYESKHNLRYWRLKNYLAFGLSGASNIDNLRFKNTESFESYFSSLKNGETPITEFEELSKQDRINEYIMLALRLNEGIDICDFNKSFKSDFLKDYEHIIEKNLKSGLIKMNDNKLFLTKKGFDLSNQVELDFFI